MGMTKALATKNSLHDIIMSKQDVIGQLYMNKLIGSPMPEGIDKDFQPDKDMLKDAVKYIRGQSKEYMDLPIEPRKVRTVNDLIAIASDLLDLLYTGKITKTEYDMALKGINTQKGIFDTVIHAEEIRTMKEDVTKFMHMKSVGEGDGEHHVTEILTVKEIAQTYIREERNESTLDANYEVVEVE